VAAGRRITVNINNGGIRYAAAAPAEPEKTAPVTASTPSTNSSETATYRVQSGDTLYAIARKYPGMTVAKIQSANNLGNDKLRVGQVLKIPGG
jgi:membrane-bound lytic murein transglycosylase D